MARGLDRDLDSAHMVGRQFGGYARSLAQERDLDFSELYGELELIRRGAQRRDEVASQVPGDEIAP